MPDIRVDFKCEKCGGVVMVWHHQSPDTMADNLMELASGYCGLNDRHPVDLRCRNCQKTVVYDGSVYVQSRGYPNSSVDFRHQGPGQPFFTISDAEMGDICAAWQKHRG